MSQTTELTHANCWKTLTYSLVKSPEMLHSFILDAYDASTPFFLKLDGQEMSLWYAQSQPPLQPKAGGRPPHPQSHSPTS